jgi:hypothetical protein
MGGRAGDLGTQVSAGGTGIMPVARPSLAAEAREAHVVALRPVAHKTADVAQQTLAESGRVVGVLLQPGADAVAAVTLALGMDGVGEGVGVEKRAISGPKRDAEGRASPPATRCRDPPLAPHPSSLVLHP